MTKTKRERAAIIKGGKEELMRLSSRRFVDLSLPPDFNADKRAMALETVVEVKVKNYALIGLRGGGSPEIVSQVRTDIRSKIKYFVNLAYKYPQNDLYSKGTIMIQ